MPEPVLVPPAVRCCVCGKLWESQDPGVLYRSADHRWWCAAEITCRRRARAADALAAGVVTALTSSEDMAAMFRALDDSWARLWARMGWDT